MPIAQIDGIVTGALATLQTVTGAVTGTGTVSGTITVGGAHDYPEYAGSYEIIPKVTAQTLDTAYRVMTDDLTVTAVPYYQTSNISGDTVYIASEV